MQLHIKITNENNLSPKIFPWKSAPAHTLCTRGCPCKPTHPHHQLASFNYCQLVEIIGHFLQLAIDFELGQPPTVTLK